MARSARSEYLTPDENIIVVAFCRGSRTALVAPPGAAAATADNHRGQFIEELLGHFVRLFCISVHAHAILQHSIRLTLQAHPERVKELADTEVARRWLCICPTLRPLRLRSVEPTEGEISALCANPHRIAEIRRQLSDIAWLMRLFQQRIALFCNREDNFRGRFWHDRYRAIVALDQFGRDLGILHMDTASVCAKSDEASSDSNSDADNLKSALHRLTDRLEADSNQLLGAIRAAANPDASVNIFRPRSGALKSSVSTTEALVLLVHHFDILFSHVAGRLPNMDAYLTRLGRRRAYVTPAVREILRRYLLPSAAGLSC